MKLVPDWHTAPASDRRLVGWQLVAIAALVVGNFVLWWTL
jgi:hypothetical protein